MMFYYGSGMHGWGIVLAALGNLVFWGILIVAATVAFRYAKRRDVGSSVPGAQSPQQILAERFARGDVNEEEFAARLKTLRGSSLDSSLR